MIDVTQRKGFEAEYAAILASRRNKLIFDDDDDMRVAEQVVGLSIRIHEAVCRAVIADEREAAKAQPQPVESGAAWQGRINPISGTPQWSLDAAKRAIEITKQAWSQSHMPGVVSRAIWKAAEAELARRVAEETAAKDERIAELEAMFETQTKCAQNYADQVAALKQQLAASQTALRNDEVEILTKDRDDWKREARAENKCALDLKAENNKLREEVERLKCEREKICKSLAGEGGPNCFSDLAPYVDSLVSEVVNLREAIADVGRVFGCEDHAEPQQYARCAEEVLSEREAELTKLRAENARLTRPVEGVKPMAVLDWGIIATQFCNVRGRGNNYRQCFDAVVLPLFEAERNAREAAERERDELREFMKERIIEGWYNNGEPTFHQIKRVNRISDAQLDAVLAAFRAEKAKVQQ